MYRHNKLALYRKMSHVLRLNKMKMAIKLYQAIDQSQCEVPLSIPQYILTLNQSEKQQFRLQNPGLSPFLFMSEQEKQEFFQRKNQQYFQKIQKKQKRLCKNKKIVKFQSNFEVKYFNKYENPTDVSSQSIESQPYHYGIHYNC